MLLVVILSVVVVVFLLVIVVLAAYICRHRRHYAASPGRRNGGAQLTSQSGLSSSSANSNVMYMQKFPLGGATSRDGGHALANFHQLKVNTLKVGVGPAAVRRPIWAASSSSAASATDSLDPIESPARVSSDIGGGGGGGTGSGSERSYVIRNNNNNNNNTIQKLDAVSGGQGGVLGSSTTNVKPLLPIIGEENPESVLSSSTTWYHPYPAPSPGSAAYTRHPGKLFFFMERFG